MPYPKTPAHKQRTRTVWVRLTPREYGELAQEARANDTPVATEAHRRIVLSLADETGDLLRSLASSLVRHVLAEAHQKAGKVAAQLAKFLDLDDQARGRR